MIDRVPALGPRAAYAKQAIRDKLIEHKQYITEHGGDMPEIRNWKWGAGNVGKPAFAKPRPPATFEKHRTSPGPSGQFPLL